MSDTANPISVDSKEISEFPYQNSFATKELLQLTDLYSNTYFVVGKSNDIKVQRAHQLSKHDKKRTQIEGDFSIAYIDHGKNPQNAAYEYVVLLDAKPKEVATFSVCNPIITANQKPITITLNGNWKANKTNQKLKVEATDNLTKLSVNSQQGQSIEFTLIRNIP